MHEGTGSKRLRDFDISGGVYVVTGGGRGLGLCMAETLVEAGGEVHCLDRLAEPDNEFYEAQSRVAPEYGGSLYYCQLDVRDTENMEEIISRIAARHERLDGLIAAAGVQQVSPAAEYSVKDATQMMAINYTGVFMSATAVGRQMMSSKAAVIRLARNLAMEWGKVKEDGTCGIRVNSISPGHIITPMVEKNFEEVTGLKEIWESENMLGRLSKPEEFKSAGLFPLSQASSFMAGQNLIIDDGHTAW